MARYITIYQLGVKLYFAGYQADGTAKFHPLKHHGVRYLDIITAKFAAQKIGRSKPFNKVVVE